MQVAILTLWVALIALTEWRWPAVAKPVRPWRRRIRNLSLGGLSLVATPATLWLFTAVTGHVNGLVEAPLIIQLLALDVWTYAMHRAYHRVPLLWRFHAPHHLDETLDVTSAFRFHIGEILISGVARLIPALLLAIDVETLILFEAVLLGCAVFHHSNIALPPIFERAAAWVIVTPSIHWVHHHNIRSDTDSNYAAILSVWDWLIRSKSDTIRWRAMPIGVEGTAELDFVRLVIRPFVSTR